MRVSTEIVGYGASGLVLLTFIMKDMRPLRVTAILSNLAFIAYGAMHALPPVLCLHFAPPPLNLARLRQLQRATGEANASLASGPLVLANTAFKVERIEPDGTGRWKLIVVVADSGATPAAAPEAPPGVLKANVTSGRRSMLRSIAGARQSSTNSEVGSGVHYA
jgi:hypothetical protein